MPGPRRSSVVSAAATSFPPASASPIRSASTATRSFAMRSLALCVFLLAACSGGNATGNAAAADTSKAGGGGGIDATGAASPSTPLGQAPFQVQQLATFDNPWALAFLPGTTNALVTEKGGHLKLWRANGGSVEVSGVPRVAAGGQGGLLDVVLSPHFETDHL